LDGCTGTYGTVGRYGRYVRTVRTDDDDGTTGTGYGVVRRATAVAERTRRTRSGGRLQDSRDGIAFYECAALNQIGLTYRADADAVVGLYINDEKNQEITLPASSGYTTVFVSQTVVKGANLRLQLETGAVTLDMIGAYPQLETENGVLAGRAEVVTDEAASNGQAVAGLDRRKKILLPCEGSPVAGRPVYEGRRTVTGEESDRNDGPVLPVVYGNR